MQAIAFIMNVDVVGTILLGQIFFKISVIALMYSAFELVEKSEDTLIFFQL